MNGFGYDYNGGISDLWASTFFGAVMAFTIVISLVAYVISCFFMMKLFAKANVPAWKAWVPCVNAWKFLELGGYKGALFLLVLIPYAGGIAVGVLECIAAYNIGLKLKKDGAWVVLYIFLNIVWYGICGLDKSTWDDSLGKPALGPEVPPSSQNRNAYQNMNSNIS